MKIKDLIFNREKLRKYDELKETIESFSNIKKYFEEHKDAKGWANRCFVNGRLMPFGIYFTPSSLDAIISALEAEIKKLDEE